MWLENFGLLKETKLKEFEDYPVYSIGFSIILIKYYK